MKTREAREFHDRLTHLFKAVDAVPDLEMKAHWSRYLCVLACGFLEVAIRSIYAAYARSKATANVANYVDFKLAAFQNPKMERILELARAFSPDWEAELERATNGEIKDAVDSIVANRHQIAHGQNTGISLYRIRDWYGQAVKLVNLVEQQCDL